MPTATLTAEFDRLLEFGAARFTYYLRIRDDAARLHQLLTGLDADRFILIADKKTPARQVGRMHARLTAAAPCSLQVITSSEHAKSLTGVMDLADAAIRAGATLRTVVVAFGRSVAGEAAGQLAALLFWGSAWFTSPRPCWP